MMALGACSGRVHYDPFRGEANKNASAILQDALNQFSSVYSVHEQGTETLEGTTVRVDLVAGRRRGGGTVSIGPATFNLVLQGSDLYVKAEAPSWSQIGYAAKAPSLANRWVHTSATIQPFGLLTQHLDITPLVTDSGPLGQVTKQPRTTVNGIAAIPLQWRATGITPYVRDSAAPGIIGAADSGASGVFTFDQYDTAEPPAVPTAAVDLDSVPPLQQR